MIRLGFHLSIAGGVYNAPITAERHRYGTFQIFASNPRGWEHRPINEEDAEHFKQVVKKSDTVPYAHTPYLCNPSSASTKMLKKSLGMLVKNMESCSMLGVSSLVVHMGSHLGKGEQHGRKTIIDTISRALDSEPKTVLLLENSSGYKNSMGSKFDETGYIIDSISSDRIGICLDTCHAFASGYDLRTAESIDKVCSEFDSNMGFKRLGLVHLNDAKYELGSGLDRHWHIGQGNIGADGFRELFRNRNFHNRCFVMETPINEHGNEITNMKNARKLAAEALGRDSVY